MVMNDWPNLQKRIRVASLLSAAMSGGDQHHTLTLPPAAPAVLRPDGSYGLKGNAAAEQDIAYGSVII